MKKSIKLFALMLGIVSMMLFSSCKKDSEDLIIGKWNVTTVEQGGDSFSPAEEGMTLTFEFTKDGKFTESVVGADIDDSASGTYTHDGDKLSMTADGETLDATIKNLDEEELVIYIEEYDSEEDFTYKTTFTMKRM